jgi:hypothetical protein
LREHLLDRELGDKDEPVQIRGDQAAKVFGGKFRERLGNEDARVVNKMIEPNLLIAARETFSAVAA